MSFEIVPGGLWVFPPFTNPNAAGGSPNVGVSNLTLATALTKIAMVFLAPKDGNLKSAEFRITGASQVPTNGLKVSFQNTTTGNKPDNTIDQFRVVPSGSIGATTWIAPGIISDDGTDGGNLRAVTAGEPVAFVIEFNSFVAGDSLTIALISGDTSTNGNLTWMASHALRSTDGGSAYTADVRPLTFALLYDDDTYECMNPFVWPMVTATSVAFHSGSTPDERGLRFIMPFDFELAGIWAKLQCGNTGSVFEVRLYSADDTVIDSVAIDPNIAVRGTNEEGIYIPMNRISPCQGNAVHRLTFLPTTANSITLERITAQSNARFGALGGGEEWYTTTRTNGGVWGDTTTERPIIGLQFSRLNAVASGGGGKGVYLS